MDSERSHYDGMMFGVVVTVKIKRKRKTIGAVDGQNLCPGLHVVENEYNESLLQKKKRRMPLFIKVPLWLIGGYLIFCFMIGGYRMLELREQLKVLEGEEQALIREQQKLEAEIEALHDEEIIEKMARESLGMVKPGETIIINAQLEAGIPEKKEMQDSFIAD